MIATLEERDRLAARLHDGWHRIEQAELAGADVSDWEAFWLQLLADYEQACRAIDGQSVISPPITEQPVQAHRLAGL